MLQIMTGRFFQREERHRTPGKGILYSNYSWILPISTLVGTLEPVDRAGAVPAYVYSFEAQLEAAPDGPRAGELISVGEDEIVRQFQLLAMFGFQAYFASDRAAVLSNCRQRAISSQERYVPARFVHRMLSDQIRPTIDEVNRFPPLVEKVLRLPRAKYVALIDVLDTIDRALLALNGSLDLAYSMVVYCLESLSQRFDKYEPTWADYDPATRGKLDDLFEAAPEVGEQARAVLVASAHLKLNERYRHFVDDHITDDFFVERARGQKGALRRSQLQRALKNAYALRSGYVHRLQSIREQLHHPVIGEWEVFEWEGQPYLTFRGLVNITMHVLSNFIARGESLDTEQVNWRSDLPGVMRFYPAPQYWIWQHEGVAALEPSERAVQVRRRFEGFLQLMVGYATAGDKVVDLRNVVGVYETLLPHATKHERSAMLATYVLYNALLGKQAMPNYEHVLKTYDKEMQRRAIEYAAIELFICDRFLHGTHDECVKMYEQYAAGRYASTTVTLPPLLEVKLLCALANSALEHGRESDHQRFLKIAMGETAGNGQVQDLLAAALASKDRIEHKAILTINKEEVPDS